MNTAYRLVWDDLRHMLVIVDENSRARSKKSGRRVRRAALPALVFSVALAGALVAPVGGEAWGASAVCVEPTTGNYVGTAIGTNSVACGDGATAGHRNSSATGTIAIGSASGTLAGAFARGQNAIAVGSGAKAAHTYQNPSSADTADANYAIAVGSEASAERQDAIAVGRGTRAKGIGAIAVGKGAKVVDEVSATQHNAADYAIAVGYEANATKQDAIAVGRSTRAWGDKNIAVGYQAWTYAETPGAIAIGSDQTGIGRIQNQTRDAGNLTAGGNSIAIGTKARNFTYGYKPTDGYYANTKNSIAIGYEAHTHAANAFAIGVSTDATAERSFAIGTTATNNSAAHQGARAGGQGSLAFGDTAIVKGQGLTSVPGGDQEDRATYTSVNDAIAVGTNTLAQARNAVVVGGGMSYTYHRGAGTANMTNETVYYKEGFGWDTRAEGTGANVGTGADGAIAIGGAVGTVDEGSNTTYFPTSAPGDVSNYTAAATIGTGATRAVAMGSGSLIGEGAINSVAVGARNVVTGERSTAVGSGDNDGANKVSAYDSGAYGNKNLVGKQDGNKDASTTEVFVFGGNNEVGKTGGNVKKTNVVGNTNKIEGSTEEDYLNVTGSNNTITKLTQSSVIGNDNTITGTGSDDYLNVFGSTNKPTALFTQSSIIGNANSISSIVGDNKNIFVLGNNVSKVAGNSVFLGDSAAYVESTGAVTDRSRGVSTTYKTNESDILDANTGRVVIKAGKLGDFAGYSEVEGVVSVGNDGQTRRIQNVAPGLIGANSTDAINGSQLYAVIGGMMPIAGDNIRFTTDPTTGRIVINALAAQVVDSSGTPVPYSGNQGIDPENNNSGTDPGDGSKSGLDSHITKYEVSGGGGGSAEADGLLVGANNSPTGTDTSAQDLGKTKGQATLFSVKGGEGEELSDVMPAGEALVSSEPTGYSTRNLTTRLAADATTGNNTVYMLMSENPRFGRGSTQVQISGDSGSVTTTDGSSTTKINPQGITVSPSGSYQTIVIQQGNVSMGGNRIQNVAPGINGTDAVNVNQLKDHHFNISAGGQTAGVYGGDTIAFTGDGNIHVNLNGQTVNIQLDPNLRVQSITLGGNTRVDARGLTINGGPSVTVNGIDAAGMRITNVADGINPYDAVNRGQLDALDNRLSNRIDKAYGGIATVAASVGVPQTTVPGSNMLGAALGGFEGETALAVGYSAMSDNGHWILKNVLSASSEEFTWTTGLGYQW